MGQRGGWVRRAKKIVAGGRCGRKFCSGAHGDARFTKRWSCLCAPQAKKMDSKATDVRNPLILGVSRPHGAERPWQRHRVLVAVAVNSQLVAAHAHDGALQTRGVYRPLVTHYR